MKAQQKISSTQVADYLLFIGYHATYFKSENRAYYNPRNRKHLLLPQDETALSVSQVFKLFDSDTTDLPCQMEWHKFQLFVNNHLKQ